MGKILIILLLFLSGCYTERKARSDIAKAHLNYPSILPALCADLFPVIETTIPGDTVFVTDTVFDAIFLHSDTTILNDTVRIVKTLPGKTVTVTNTITRVDTIIKVNTAEIAACAIARDNALQLAAEKTADVAKYKKLYRRWLWISLGLLAAALVWGYFKVKSSIIKK